jgi:NitT/TauT family transport system substrate-binding protein
MSHIVNAPRRRQFLTATLAGACVTALARPAIAQTPAPIRGVRMVLDWALEGQQSPFVLAADGGLFAEAGVEVRVDRGYGSGDTVTKVASGAYDIGFADIGAAIAFNGRQNDLKVISVFQVYDVAPLAIMTLRDSGITSVRDLAGRTVAAPPGDSSRVMFPLLARANNIDVSAINWIDVTPQLRETLLAQRRVDAITAQVTSLLSFRPLRMEDQVRVLRYVDFGVDLYGHAIITTPAYANANPEAVRRVLRGVAAAWRRAANTPAASVAALARREALVDEALENDRIRLVLDAAVRTPHVLANGLSSVVPARLERTITAVGGAFGVSPPPAAQMYRPDFLPPASERML